MTNAVLDIERLDEQESTKQQRSGELPGPIAAIFKVLGGLMLVLNVVASFLGVVQWWIIIPAALLKVCGVIHFSWFLIGSPILITFALSMISLVLALVMGGAVSLFNSDRKQPWYELVWMATPLVLVLSFGLLGALVAAGGTFANSRVFNSKLPTAAKYVITAFISSSSFVIWLAVALLLEHLRPHH